MNKYTELTMQSRQDRRQAHLNELQDRYGSWFDEVWPQYESQIETAARAGHFAVILCPQWPPALTATAKKGLWERIKGWFMGIGGGQSQFWTDRAEYQWWLRHKLKEKELGFTEAYYDRALYGYRRNIAVWSGNPMVWENDL